MFNSLIRCVNVDFGTVMDPLRKYSNQKQRFGALNFVSDRKGERDRSPIDIFNPLSNWDVKKESL